MIYTVTFNPSLDYIVYVDTLKTGQLNRTTHEQVFYGGKGINIAKICREFEQPARVLGYVAGYIGEAIAKGAHDEMHLDTDFIVLKKGLSRINVKIKGQEETFINPQGPAITSRDLDKLFEKLDALQEGDLLVLAGSLPKGMAKDTYKTIMEHIDPDVKVVIDAEGELLQPVLSLKPDLVKIKVHELAHMYHDFTSHDEIIAAARDLLDQGAKCVLISMAEEGSMCVTPDHVYKAEAVEGRIINSVGASASLTAGFIISYFKDGDPLEALKLGEACAAATAMSDHLGTKSHALYLLEKVKGAKIA